MTTRVDQILSGYDTGDAISREARVFRDVLRELGHESEIFAPADHIGSTVSEDALPLDSFKEGEDYTLMYHFSIGSPATDLFMRHKGKQLVRYHNITPPHFFKGYDHEMVLRLEQGRRELGAVAKVADLVIADSGFNADDAREAGCQRAKVMELVADLDEVEPDERKIDRYDDEMGNILFVGRMVPNKCVEDLIMAFRWINKVIDHKSRLILVGSERSCPEYYSMLKMLACELDLDNVCFEGYLNEAELSACYCCADVFVCASRHEGYCLPLVEAMKYDVPVIARDCGGMPQALGGAGVLYDDLDFPVFGELIAKVMWDYTYRRRVQSSQEKRLEAIRSRDLKQEWSDIL